MKCASLHALLIVVTILTFKPEAPAMEQQELLIFDFMNSEKREHWRIINDGVMGGLSKSEIIFSNSNTAIFKGIISLENNGGFASVRTKPLSYDLDGYNGILLRVKGDGKKYQFRLRTNANFDGVSYRYQFETDINSWIIIKIPFHKCLPVFRGRILKNVKPILPADIQQIGFLISNKKAEKFQLEIDWIKAYKK